MGFVFCRELADGCKSLHLDINDHALQQLEVYFTELKKWSKKVNLIAKETEDRQILENHFLDSLVLLSELDEGAVLVDIGTGGGFPGLVCKVARPEMKLYLVEPRLKRVSFLNHLIRTLSLEDVVVKCNRIEDETNFFETERVSHVTCRAVADIAGFLEMTSHFKRSVKRVCLKGPKWREEFQAAGDIMAEHGLWLERVSEYQLPVSRAERAIIILNGIQK